MCRQIASVGALLVVAGLVVDPLSQQLVHYRVESVRDELGNASVPFAVSWTDSTQGSTTSSPSFDGELPPLPMKGMIQNGLYSQNTVVQDVQPACSSANCTWQSYRSLAVCARLADVTKSLKSETVTVPGPYRNSPKVTISKWYLSEHNYLLDNGYTVFNISTVAKPLQSLDDLTSEATKPDFSDSIAFKNISGPLADVFMIYASSADSSEGAFAAIEFVLEWCVQNFTSSVTNGVSSTERHDSFSGFSSDEPFAYQTASPDDGDNRQYEIEYRTHHILRNYFFTLLNGTTKTNPGTPFSTNDAVQALYQPVSVLRRKVDGVDYDPGRGEGQVGLQRILDNIATGMTNLIRSKGNTITAASDPDSTVTTIQGTAFKEETSVKVQWGWIAAPIILLVGSLLFVFATIMSSLRHRPGLWKSSSFPLLKALGAELHQEDPNGMKALSMMKDCAECVPVRLSRDNDDDGWKLRRRWSEKTEAESHET